ncbi:MAG: hypothetical protein IJZ75_02240 [Clostridia bacterium]|nr:hypothetical protein [Clostridia bacterium]
MKNNNVRVIQFSFGAIGYGFLELLWRGRTHWSMLIAGGLSFLGLGSIGKRMKNCSAVKKAVAGSLLITSIEFVFGVIFNIILKRNVWNYSKMPLNLFGQVCALYSVLWGILSLALIPFTAVFEKYLKKE